MKRKPRSEDKFLHTSKVDTAARLVKNSAAMFTAAALAKGGGLIVTILVARYLDPASLGVYAVVLALALLLEVVTPLGQQEVVIRAIARDRSLMFRYWVNASAATLVSSLAFGLVFVGFARLADYGMDATFAIYIAALSLPVAGVNLVAQAVLQGIERMEYQTAAALVGRVLGLLVLWALLELDAGIWSAFFGRAVFQVTSLVILSRAILQQAGKNNLARDWRPSVSLCRATLSTALPFALQRFLAEGMLRINVIILPMLVTLTTVGLFNAANQITQTSSTIIPIVTLTLLPLFSRTFTRDRARSGLLMDQTLKFLLILIFPFAFVVTVMADKIILLLYGAGYEASVAVLQLVIWSQVFVAADSVMKQSMIASDNERAMVWRSALGTVTSIALTVVLSKAFGLLGIAAAVVISSALLLALDAVFVKKYLFHTNLPQAVGKPFLCAALAGLVALALMDRGLLVVLAATAGAYIVFLVLFKAFTPAERALIGQLSRRLLSRIKR